MTSRGKFLGGQAKFWGTVAPLAPPSSAPVARSSVYAYFLEMVVGKSKVWMLKTKISRSDLSGSPFLRCRNLLHLFLTVARVKLRLSTSSMIIKLKGRLTPKTPLVQSSIFPQFLFIGFQRYIFTIIGIREGILLGSGKNLH